MHRRRCLLAGDHGLHLHRGRPGIHVHHGAGGDPGGHRGACQLRRARRGRRAQRDLRRRALPAQDRGGMRGRRAAAPVLPALEQRREAAIPADHRRPRTRGPRAADDRARGPEQALRHARARRPRARRPRVLRGAAVLRAEHHRRLWAAWRARGGHRRQPAKGAGGRHRHQRLGEGRPIHPLLRRVRDRHRLVRRRAGLSTRARPGARRDHPARRQAALRVRGSDRAQAHSDHAQGLRRRVLRHVAQADGRGPQPGVAHGGDRGHGPGRGREHHLQARPRLGARSSRPPQGARGRVHDAIRKPIRCR